MHTACSLTISWGVCPGGCLPGGVFDVTSMLSLYQLRLITSAAAYIVFGHVTCDACWDTPPHMDRMTHMCKNITFPQTSFAGGNESDSLHL